MWVLGIPENFYIVFVFWIHDSYERTIPFSVPFFLLPSLDVRSGYRLRHLVCQLTA